MFYLIVSGKGHTSFDQMYQQLSITPSIKRFKPGPGVAFKASRWWSSAALQYSNISCISLHLTQADCAQKKKNYFVFLLCCTQFRSYPCYISVSIQLVRINAMVVKSESNLGTRDHICPCVALCTSREESFFFMSFVHSIKRFTSHFTVQPSAVELIYKCREQFSFIEYKVCAQISLASILLKRLPPITPASDSIRVTMLINPRHLLNHQPHCNGSCRNLSPFWHSEISFFFFFLPPTPAPPLLSPLHQSDLSINLLSL